MLAVDRAKLNVFDRALLHIAIKSFQGAVSGQILIGLLGPMRHPVGRYVNRVRSEKDPVANLWIDRERRIEHRPRIVNGIE